MKGIEIHRGPDAQSSHTGPLQALGVYEDRVRSGILKDEEEDWPDTKIVQWVILRI